MDDDFKQALGQAFINIGNTEEGKEVIAIYSHKRLSVGEVRGTTTLSGPLRR